MAVLVRRGSGGLRGIGIVLIGVALAAWVAAPAAPADAGPFGASGSDFVGRLAQARPVQSFGRPVFLHADVRDGRQQLRLEALVTRPFADLQAALAGPLQWCETMLLHINNAACRAVVGRAGDSRILLKVMRDPRQPSDEAFEFEFRYEPLQSPSAPLAVRLSAPSGPLGTREHELLLAAAPAGDARSALQLSYAYSRSALADWAMHLFLDTLGRGREGFSAVDDSPDPLAPRIGGVRGLLERNLVLYLFAIEAAATAPSPCAEAEHRRRLQAYFRATEQHPKQLREVTWDEYLALKAPLTATGLSGARPPGRC